LQLQARPKLESTVAPIKKVSQIIFKRPKRGVFLGLSIPLLESRPLLIDVLNADITPKPAQLVSLIHRTRTVQCLTSIYAKRLHNIAAQEQCTCLHLVDPRLLLDAHD
jgi:hypothetical protein